MQRYSDSPRRPGGIQRQSAIRISPVSQQEVRVNKSGSVVIPRRTPVRDDAMDGAGARGPLPRAQESSSLATAFVSPRIARAASSRQPNRVHFATPVGTTTTTPVAPAVPASHQSQTGLSGDNQLGFQTKPSFNPLSQQRSGPVQSLVQINNSSGQIPISNPQFSGVTAQPIPAFPGSYPTASPAIPFSAAAPTGGQLGISAAPAFAVIAPDSAALQALLSGNIGGRAFIIQPLNMSPYAASTQMVCSGPTFVGQPSPPPSGVPCSLPTYGPSSNFAFSADAQRTPMMFAQNWGPQPDPGVYSNPFSGQSQMFSSQPIMHFAQPLTSASVGAGAPIFTQPSEMANLSTSFTHLPSSSLQNPVSSTQVQKLMAPPASVSLPGSLCNSPNPDETNADAAGQIQPLQPPLSPPPPPQQIHTGNLVTPQTHRAAFTSVQPPLSSAPTSQSQDVGDNNGTNPQLRRTPGKLIKFRDSFASPREEPIKTSLRQPQKLQVPPFLQSQDANPPLKPIVSQPQPPHPPAPPPTQEPTPVFTAAITVAPTSATPVAKAPTSNAQHQQPPVAPVPAVEAPTLTTPPRRWPAGQHKDLLKKAHSLPESEHLKTSASSLKDTGIHSVADRARMWLRQRQAQYATDSNFVDRDLVACEDLVPVEDRVRAFNSGKVAEANAAERRRLQEDYEEALSRRLQEQFGMEEASVSAPPQTTTPATVLLTSQPQVEIKDASTRPTPGPIGGNLTESARSRGTSRLRSLAPSRNMMIPERTQPPSQLQMQCNSPRVIFNDPLARMSVREKSNIFNRRSTGGKPPKVERQRRKTQPITFDDIARANQRILDSAGGLALETPLESFIDEEFDLGSICSSPAASVLSDVSEYGLPLSPKSRTLIF